MDERLLKASINDLAAFLRGRFQMQGPWAADTGARESEFPYDLPLAVWKGADANMRRNLVQATQTLVGEIPGPGWSAEAIEWFVAFIDLADMQEVRAALADAAEKGRWLSCAADAPACHTVLLRTLLDMGWAGSPDFWRHLPEEAERRYPALGFRGLLADDMDAAFAYLRRVARDREAARQIVDALAGMMDDAKSRKEVRRQLSCLLSDLPPEAADEFRKWFRVHRWGDLPGGPAEAPQPVVVVTRRQLIALGLSTPPAAVQHWTEAPTNGGKLLFALQPSSA
jgi:hypothetical protein